ncbi:hypothetical protein D3C87_1914320 [compost metagenome]
MAHDADQHALGHFYYAHKIAEAHGCTHSEHNDLDERGNEGGKFEIAHGEEMLRVIQRRSYRRENDGGVGEPFQFFITSETDGK